MQFNTIYQPDIGPSQAQLGTFLPLDLLFSVGLIFLQLVWFSTNWSYFPSIGLNFPPIGLNFPFKSEFSPQFCLLYDYLINTSLKFTLFILLLTARLVLAA